MYNKDYIDYERSFVGEFIYRPVQNPKSHKIKYY